MNKEIDKIMNEQDPSKPRGSKSKGVKALEDLSLKVKAELKNRSNSFKRKFELLIQCHNYLNVFLKIDQETGKPMRSSGHNIDVNEALKVKWRKLVEMLADDENLVSESELLSFLRKCMGDAGGTEEIIDPTTGEKFSFDSAEQFSSYLKRTYPDSQDPIDSALDSVSEEDSKLIKDFFIKLEKEESLASQMEEEELKAKYGKDFETSEERQERVESAREIAERKRQISINLASMAVNSKETISKLKQEKIEDAIKALGEEDITPIEYYEKIKSVLEIGGKEKDRYTWKEIAALTAGEFRGTSGVRQYFQSRFPKAFRFSIDPGFKGEVYYEIFQKFLEVYQILDLDPTEEETYGEKYGDEEKYSESETDIFLIAQGISKEDFIDYFSITDFTQRAAYKKYMQSIDDPEERAELEKEFEDIDNVMRAFVTESSHFRNFVTLLLDLYYRKNVYLKAEYNIIEPLIDYMKRNYPAFGKGYNPDSSKTYGTIEKDKGQAFVKPIINIITGQAGVKGEDLIGMSFALGKLGSQDKDEFIKVAVKAAEKAKKADPKMSLGSFHNFGEKEAADLFDEIMKDSTPLGEIRTSFLKPGEGEHESFKSWFKKLKNKDIAQIFVKSLEDASRDTGLIDQPSSIKVR